jgi:hypothetical protein
MFGVRQDRASAPVLPEVSKRIAGHDEVSLDEVEQIVMGRGTSGLASDTKAPHRYA